jgi:hypothetical protein
MAAHAKAGGSKPKVIGASTQWMGLMQTGGWSPASLPTLPDPRVKSTWRPGTQGKNGLPPADMMVDLATRFVLNAPAEELRSFERMLFLIEQVGGAHPSSRISSASHRPCVLYKHCTPTPTTSRDLPQP